MNPSEKARNAALAQQAAKLPPDLRRFLAQAAIQGQRAVQSWPYYSKVVLAAAQAGGGPFTYTFPAQAVRFFSYGIGGNVANIGLAAPIQATYADTNIQEAYRTVKSEKVFIQGVALHILPDPRTPPELLALVWQDTSLSVVGGGGTVTQRLGPPALLGQRAGLFGPIQANNVEPPLNSGVPPVLGFPQSSEPDRGNFFPFPYEIVWGPSGSGADDMFGIEMRLERPIVANAPANRAAAAGVAAYTAPGDLIAQFMAELIVTTESRRSLNQ